MQTSAGAIFQPMRGRLPWLLGLALAAGAAAACRAKAPKVEAPFRDDFTRAELGADWNATDPAAYRIADGRMTVANAYNHPAWLRRRLPDDVVIDVDVLSRSPAGDIKLELFGDGASYDPDKGAYTSTGYVLIFGGWNNSLSVICRQEEHGAGRKAERADVRVEPGRTYHFTIKRQIGAQGGAIDWSVDGKPFLAWTDPEPLAGAGHEHLAVNDWQADVSFDNLVIRPAP
jgi:hypothetical protein